MGGAAGHPGKGVEPLHHELAPATELLDHRARLVHRASERRHAGVLDERGDAGGRVHEEPDQGIDERLGHRGEPAAPAGHRERLGQPVQEHGPLQHPGHRGDARELAVVLHLRVDLVREQPGVAVGQQLARSPDLLRREDPARRVLRRVEDHEPRPRAEARRELVGVEAEVVDLPQRQGHGRRAQPADRRLIDREAGIRIDDLVAGVAGGEDREEQERLGTGSDEHPRRRYVDAPGGAQVLRRRLAQLGDPGRRAVVGLPRAQRRHAGLDHVRRSGEIGLPDLEMDDMATGSLQLPGPRQHAERRLGAEPLEAPRERRRGPSLHHVARDAAGRSSAAGRRKPRRRGSSLARDGPTRPRPSVSAHRRV